MVVLLPLNDDEISRVCRGCNTLGLESPVRERSTFLRRKKRNGWYGYEASCKACDRRRKNEWRLRKIETDPEWTARRKEKNRKDALRRRREDPVNYLAIARRYRERLAADPKRRQQRNDNQRIERLLRLERKGVPLPKPKPHQHGKSEAKLPVEPFRDWLVRLIRDAEAVGEDRENVGELIGIGARRIHWYLNGAQYVDELVVDKCVTNEGHTLMSDLYPELEAG